MLKGSCPLVLMLIMPKQKNNIVNKNQGYVALTTVLVISVVILVIGISVSLLAISEGQMSLAEVKGTQSLNFVDSCVEDVLLRANEDENYSGGTLTLPEGNCTVVVNKVGTDWTVTVEGTLDGYRKKIQVEFSRVPPDLTLNSWQETD